MVRFGGGLVEKLLFWKCELSAKADTWRTQAGHMADKRRTQRGHMADKAWRRGPSGTRRTRGGQWRTISGDAARAYCGRPLASTREPYSKLFGEKPWMQRFSSTDRFAQKMYGHLVAMWGGV